MEISSSVRRDSRFSGSSQLKFAMIKVILLMNISPQMNELFKVLTEFCSGSETYEMTNERRKVFWRLVINYVEVDSKLN
jgi:hypothetical protein